MTPLMRILSICEVVVKSSLARGPKPGQAECTTSFKNTKLVGVRKIFFYGRASGACYANNR